MGYKFNPFIGNFDEVGSGGGGGTISGTIADDQIAFGTAADTIGGSNDLTWDGLVLAVTGTVAATVVNGTTLQQNGKTIALSGNLTTTGAFDPTFAIPSSSTWTFPSGGGTLSTATGTVTNIATTSPISGGPITGTGTLSLLVNIDHAFTAAQSITRAGIGAVSSDGVVLTNTTAAAAGAQQWSPRLHLTGQGWKTAATAASQTVDWIAEVVPVEASAAPTSALIFSSQINAGGYTARLTLNSAGQTLSGIDGTASNVAFGRSAATNTGMYFPGTNQVGFVANGAIGLSVSSTQVIPGTTFPITWGGDTSIQRDAANTLANRNGTNAQKFRVYNTFTTLDTAGEWFAIDWQTTANTVNLQAVKGSSTGTARPLTISYGGNQASPVAAITVPITSGNITFGGGITLPGGATFLTTNTALTDGAGMAAGSLLTAPTAGNPTKWIGINDNGTTRYVPAW